MPALVLVPVAASTARRGLSSREWLLCAVVGLGFVFDTFEIVVMPIVVRPALLSLGMTAGSAALNRWVGLMLYVPVATAGVFGLIGGYLIDRFGRRRMVVCSLLLYGIATLAAAFAWSPLTLLAARCVTLTGVSLELVAALTWLAELFSDPARRERVLGYSQIASGVGNFVATGVYYVAVTWAARLPALGGHHDAWRYALTAGAIPCVPLLIVRSWLPESPLWTSLRAQDARHRPLIATLFRPPLRRGTIVATLMTACVYAGAYGVLQHAPRLVPVLPDARDLAPRLQEQIVSAVHFFGSLGEVVGRLVFASLVVAVARQRQLLRAFMVPALIVVPGVFVYAATSGIVALGIASFVATLLVMGSFSFVGNYLPRLFPTDVRGTGESVAINIGGRVIGAAAAFATPQVATVFRGLDPALQLAAAMAVTAIIALGAGCLLTAWLPEPESGRLP